VSGLETEYSPAPCEREWKISLLAWRQLEPTILCKRILPSTQIVATSSSGHKNVPEIKSYLLQMLLTKKITCPLLFPLLSNDLANLEK